MTARMSARRYARLLPALLLTLLVANPSAQTKITPDKNSYSVADDVKVGQEAAAEAKKQLPMLNDDQVDKFVERVGARLAAAIDGELATQASATPSTWSTRKKSTLLPFRAGRCSSIAE